MSRKSVKPETIRALFARSGNRCAFPGCIASLINERNQFIGQICHIEAAEPGGERYNLAQTDEQRRQYDNLILLCYPHHIETNEVNLYPASRLFKMKEEHEKSRGQTPFKIDESLLYKIVAEMDDYWKSIDKAHRFRHVISDLAIPIKADSTYLSLAQDSYVLIGKLHEYKDMIDSSDVALVGRVREFVRLVGSGKLTDEEYHARLHAFSGSNWEVLNLGVTNTLKELRVRLIQMEIKYLEEYLKTNYRDKASCARLDSLKVEFSELATHAGYVD